VQVIKTYGKEIKICNVADPMSIKKTYEVEHRDFPSTRARANSDLSTRYSEKSSREGNIMRFDAFSSQGMKRPQMDIYYTEISWQGSRGHFFILKYGIFNAKITCLTYVGVIGPGQLASRAKFCHDKKIRVSHTQPVSEE
jgi:hypothetical protein